MIKIKLSTLTEKNIQIIIDKFFHSMKVMWKTYKYFYLITLTFSDTKSFLEFQKNIGIRHIINYLAQFYKDKTGKRDITNVWVFEFLKRDPHSNTLKKVNPHYHILIATGQEVKFPKLDETIFTYGYTNIKRVKSNNWEEFEELTNYLVKQFYDLLIAEDRETMEEYLKELRRDCGVKFRVYGIGAKAKDEKFLFRFSFKLLLKRMFGISYKFKTLLWEDNLILYGGEIIGPYGEVYELEVHELIKTIDWYKKLIEKKFFKHCSST